MIYKKIVLLLCVICLIAVPASATVISVNNPAGLAIVDDDSGKFAVCSDNNISIGDIYGGAYSNKLVNIPSKPLDVEYFDDYLYYVCENGNIYKSKYPGGHLLFDSSESGNSVLLGSVSSYDKAEIAIDSNSDLYVSEFGYIKKFASPTYSSVIIYTTPSGEIWSFTPGLNNTIIASYSQSGTVIELYSNLSTNNLCSNLGSVSSMYSLTNGNFLYQTSTTLYERYSYPTFSSTYSLATGLGTYNNNNDMVVFSNGIIAFSDYSTDSVKTYLTTDGIGGYTASGSSTSSNLYQNQLIESIYSTYYNNQNIQTHYLVATSVYNETYQDYYKDTYGIQVELLDENESLVNSYFVDGSQFEAYDFTNPLHNWFTNLLLSYVLDEYLMINGYHDFSNTENWPSGNYSLKMYEVNKYTGAKALLASDTLEIYNSTSPYYNTSSESNTDYTTSQGSGDFSDMQDNIINLLTTKAFWGVIIWSGLVIGIAQRRDNNGDHIDTKQIGIFAIIAAVLLAIAGAFDPYKWFVIAICIILAAVAFVNFGKGFSGLGGN